MGRAAAILSEARDARRDLTQADIARATGATQQTVSRWLSGRILPPPERVAALAKVLGVDRRQLLDAVLADAKEERETELTLPRRVADLERRLAAVEGELRRRRRG